MNITNFDEWWEQAQRAPAYAAVGKGIARDIWTAAVQTSVGRLHERARDTPPRGIREVHAILCSATWVEDGLREIGLAA